MPAPRLLDKKHISASLATERKQEIDKGVKLAKSIDALRETRAKEERDLEEWRVNTLKTVQAQIAVHESENARLAEENRNLKAQRIQLEGPIDLVEAWNEVHSLKERNESISDDLLKREINITTRENDVHDAAASLFEREQEVVKSEQVAEQNLRQSESERDEAVSANQEAQRLLTDTKQDRADFEAVSQRKSEELDVRASDLALREEALEAERIEINREKILLADRRATLDRGFDELRRKQNGTVR